MLEKISFRKGYLYGFINYKPDKIFVIYILAILELLQLSLVTIVIGGIQQFWVEDRNSADRVGYELDNKRF